MLRFVLLPTAAQRAWRALRRVVSRALRRAGLPCVARFAVLLRKTWASSLLRSSVLRVARGSNPPLGVASAGAGYPLAGHNCFGAVLYPARRPAGRDRPRRGLSGAFLPRSPWPTSCLQTSRRPDDARRGAGPARAGAPGGRRIPPWTASLLASPPLTRKRWGRRATRCHSPSKRFWFGPAPGRAVGRGIERGAAHLASDVAAGRPRSAAVARATQVLLGVHEHAVFFYISPMHSAAVGRRAHRRGRPGTNVPPPLHPAADHVPWVLDQRRRWPVLDGVCAARVCASVLLEHGLARRWTCRARRSGVAVEASIASAVFKFRRGEPVPERLPCSRPWARRHGLRGGPSVVRRRPDPWGPDLGER